MNWNQHTNICTYRVKPGAREKFIALLRKHWPALRAAGLVNDTPALHFEAEVKGNGQNDQTGATFVEIFSWSRPDALQLVHNTPAVMALWEPMGALVEARDGRPGMEFPNCRPLDLDV